MPSGNKKKILLIPPKKNLVVNALRTLGDNEFVWCYFGENISTALEIEKIVGKNGLRLNLGKKIQEKARKLKEQYIDYIGSLSGKFNSLSWWTSSVSEKNPLVSKTFLNSIYISIAQDYLNSSQNFKNFVFFIESSGLKKSFLKNLSKFNDYEMIAFESVFNSQIESINHNLKMFLIKLWFIFESLNRICISKFFFSVYTGQKDSSKGLTLIHTWIDNRSFTPEGKFRDSYLGELGSKLKEKGENVVIVPYVLSDISYRKALKKMKLTRENFLLPYAYIRIRDVFSIILRIIFTSTSAEFSPFGEIEISDLLLEDLKRDKIGIRQPRDFILNRVVREWKKSGIPIKYFIYPFENQTWEKSYSLAIRKLYPEAKMVAFQHAATSIMSLNYFFSSSESKIIPLPDKIITSGRYNEKKFIESGYDSNKVFSGGAIRFASLLEKPKIRLEKTAISEKFTVLVTTSISPIEATELFWKALKAFGGCNKYNVIIKCHPVMPYHKFAKDLGNEKLPENFEISSRPIPELLRESNVLLYTSSTTCIEAIALGVPVIHLESDFVIDIDPLDFTLEFRDSVNSPEELKKNIGEIGTKDRNRFLIKQKMGKKILNELFGEVNDSVYDLFLSK
jgi:hypothetical protein